METITPETTRREHQRTSILTSLSRGATRSAACRAAGLARRTLYNWVEQDPDFREQVEEAELEAIENVEGVAYECAIMAADDPRYQRSMLAFLKAKSPAWGAPARKEPEPAGPSEPEPEPEPEKPTTDCYPRPRREGPVDPDLAALLATVPEDERAFYGTHEPAGLADMELLVTRELARLHDQWEAHLEWRRSQGLPVVPLPPLPNGHTSYITYLCYEEKMSVSEIRKHLNLPYDGTKAPPLPTWPPPPHLRRPGKVYRKPIHPPADTPATPDTPATETATPDTGPTEAAPPAPSATLDTPDTPATPDPLTKPDPSTTGPPQNRPPTPPRTPARPDTALVHAPLS